MDVIREQALLAVKDGERTFSFKVTIFEAFIHGFDEVIQSTDKLWNADSPLTVFCHQSIMGSTYAIGHS